MNFMFEDLKLWLQQRVRDTSAFASLAKTRTDNSMEVYGGESDVVWAQRQIQRHVGLMA